MKKYNDYTSQLVGESVEAILSDKAKLSLYKKSSNSDIPVSILEEVYRRGYTIWNDQFGGTPEQFAFDRVNSFIAGGFAAQLDEDLLDEKRGLWDNIHAKRARIKAGSGEHMRKPGSKGAPTDAALKASQNEDADPCWKGYKQIGMKKKGGRSVPNCVPANEDAEAHSKDFKKPSSRFIGSNELVDVYKSQTPGQIIKKVVRENLQEVAMAMPPQVTPPAIVGQVRPGVRVAPKPTEVSGRASGRIASQGSSMTARPNVKVTSGVQPSIERSWKTSGRASVGTGGGSMSATPKVSTSYSQGGVNVGKTMSTAKQTSPVVKGMTDAGRSAIAGVEKAAPALAKGIGTAARIATGPAATAAMAVMSPTPAGAGEDEKKRQETLKSYNPYKSSGRSVSDYEKQVLTPQKYEAPKAPAAPKVDAPTPPSRPEFFSRGEAFKAAREKAGGGEGQFKYDNKSFQTNVPGEKYIAPEKQKQTGIEAESGGKTLKKIKEAISEATYKGKTVPLNKPMKGDVKKSKVFVDPDGDGKAQKVNFGDKNMSIKKDQPARKRSYCARSGGISGTNDKTSANYWSRRAWNCEETEVNELSVPAGTTGKRETVSTPMVAVRMASGKIEKHPPGKSGSSGGGGNGAE